MLGRGNVSAISGAAVECCKNQQRASSYVVLPSRALKARPQRFHRSSALSLVHQMQQAEPGASSKTDLLQADTNARNVRSPQVKQHAGGYLLAALRVEAVAHVARIR